MSGDGQLVETVRKGVNYRTGGSGWIWSDMKISMAESYLVLISALVQFLGSN